MVKLVFSIYDTKLERYRDPIYIFDENELKMQFRRVLLNGKGKDNQPDFVQMPDEFVLFRLGSFDTEKGEFANEAKMICTLSELAKE